MRPKKAKPSPKPSAKPRSQPAAKNPVPTAKSVLTKQNFKTSPVTLSVKGNKKPDLRAQAKYVLPLLPRMDTSPNAQEAPKEGPPSITLNLREAPPSNPLNLQGAPPSNPLHLQEDPSFHPSTQTIQTYRLAPQGANHSPNLLFLEPIPESELGPQELKTSPLPPLPSMETLKRNNTSEQPCQLYVILKSGGHNTVQDSTTFYTPDEFRPRRDSGSSSGLSFRSLSSSPSSNLSNGGDLELDTSLDSMETGLEGMDMDMEGMQTMDIEKSSDIPESPTALEPTIDQLFKRPGDFQRIEAMEQFIILEDIHQIIGEAS